MKPRFHPFYSLFHYCALRKNRRIRFIQDHIDEQRVVHNQEFTIFQEVELLTEQGHRKEGNVIFQVIFRVPVRRVPIVIRNTHRTMPFFMGLPGFCNKQYMVDSTNGTFSGRYEWEDEACAQQYAQSYAVKFMAHRSKPHPLQYWIIDKATQQIIEHNNVSAST